MKNLSIWLILLFCFPFIQIQSQIPKNSGEDKGKVMSEAYWEKWNSQVQARIEEDIEKYRKADASFKISSVPIGTEVTIEQVSHDFIFGANIFNYNQLGSYEQNRKYKKLFGTLFNSATIPFYWKTFEMQPNRLRFKEEYWDTEEFWNNIENPQSQPHWRRPATDPIVEFCEKKGINMLGHPLVWGIRSFHHPNWIVDQLMTQEEKIKMDKLTEEYATSENYFAHEKYKEEYNQLTPDQLEEIFPEYTKTVNHLMEKRILEIVNRYRGRIHSWDVVNESADDYMIGALIPNKGLSKSRYGIMPGDYDYQAFKISRNAFPDHVLLSINDYANNDSYVNQVKNLLLRGCKIDILGSQMHLFNPQQCLDIAAGMDIESPDIVWKKMSVLSQTELPIHLSEITITAPGDDTRGRDIQAIIAYNLYRLWFSVENMMGITWWNIVDDCGAPNEPNTSGLFTRDMQPKPSYFALNKLINEEWKTNLRSKVDENGQVKFRGFKGRYRVTWKDNKGLTKSAEFYLRNNGDNFNL